MYSLFWDRSRTKCDQLNNKFSQNQGGLNPPLQNSGGLRPPPPNPPPPCLAPLVKWPVNFWTFRKISRDYGTCTD